MRHANGMPETPVVNCVLLWARPGMEAALSAYEDKVLRLIAEHGGRVLVASRLPTPLATTRVRSPATRRSCRSLTWRAVEDL
jgi:hypothetical protein